MINKIYGISLVTMAALLLSACGDKFLDFEPVAAENSASFYLTMDQADQAVAAAYGVLNTRTIWDRNVILYMGDVPSDDAEGGGAFENEVPAAEQFNYHSILTANSHLLETYGNLYRGIYFCNVAMENIPNVLEVDPNANAAIIEQRIGELKFLRALNYMYLTQLFGQVPLVDHVLTPSEYEMDKVTIGEIYDLIEQDLSDAIQILPERSGLGAENIGRATVGAAKSLLARMYVFESSYNENYAGDERFGEIGNRWQEAFDLCEDVINSGEYSLIGINGEKYDTWRGPQTNGYSYLFTVEGENSQESVFAIQFINDGEAYTESRGGSLVQWSAARWTYLISEEGDTVDQNTSFWGLGWPTQEHVDEYEAGDVRLHTNVSMPGDSIELKDGSLTLPVNFEYSGTGYYLRKYELPAHQYGTAPGHEWHKSPQNIYLIRYADVVLMAAEAALKLNRNGDALHYINLVRERARMAGDGSAPTELTGVVTMDQLMHERRVELAFEGRRYADMVRWDIAVNILNGYVTPGGYTVEYRSPKNDFFPLPQREITASNGGLTQVAGY